MLNILYHRFFFTPANIRVGQQKNVFLRHYAQEASNNFHISAADRTYKELSNALSHVLFEPVVNKFDSFSLAVFGSYIF